MQRHHNTNLNRNPYESGHPKPDSNLNPNPNTEL